MKRTATDERVIISAAVPQTLRADLKRRARQADRTLSGEVRRALARYLEPTTSDNQTEEGEPS
jgi:hypothetical protein